MLRCKLWWFVNVYYYHLYMQQLVLLQNVKMTFTFHNMKLYCAQWRYSGKQTITTYSVQHNTTLHSSRKYPYCPHGLYLILHTYSLPPSHQEIPVYLHTLLLKYFWLLRSSLPLEISDDVPRGGYRFFQELHICWMKSCTKMLPV